MNVVYANQFAKQFKKLPEIIQEQYLNLERLFRMNWRDSRLHVKKLKGEEGIYSFRVTRRYGLYPVY